MVITKIEDLDGVFSFEVMNDVISENIDDLRDIALENNTCGLLFGDVLHVVGINEMEVAETKVAIAKHLRLL